jgi:hypothetical protein
MTKRFKDRTMNRNIAAFFSLMGSMTVLAALAGCASTQPSARTPSSSFLSDYSRLESVSDTSHRYINPKYNLGDYSKFIVDRVEVRFPSGHETGIGDWDELEKLRTYMRSAMVKEIGYNWKVVSQPGPATARIRIALTNVKSASILELGGVSMEAEIVDTQTGEQIAALIDSRRRGRQLGEYYKWDAAKAIMDEWARQFYRRLRETRRY